jgi:hypothetical protein
MSTGKSAALPRKVLRDAMSAPLLLEPDIVALSVTT